jgi:hypothetical protein
MTGECRRRLRRFRGTHTERCAASLEAADEQDPQFRTSRGSSFFLLVGSDLDQTFWLGHVGERKTGLISAGEQKNTSG